MDIRLEDTNFALPSAQLGDDLTIQVIEAIRIRGACSQSDVIRLTGLGRTPVAERIRQMTALGLFEANGTVSRLAGRPPRALQLRASAGHLLVASLGAASMDVALADVGGRILASEAEPVRIGDGPEAVLGRVDEIWAHLQTNCASLPGPLLGIGLAVPGPVEFSTGRPVAPPIMPGWDNYPIRERFSARYGAPVWVDNDVNVMALGEWREGIARGHKNVVFVKIGTGIGAGVISDGALHRGAQGAAGDVGHIQVTDDPVVVCRCGNVGCLEAIAGGAALGREAERVARAGGSGLLAAALNLNGSLKASDVVFAAMHGDATSVELLQRSGRLVGSMLASVVNLLNPSLIVVGGGVAAAGDVFLAAVRERVYARSLPLATRQLLVAQSALGDRAGTIGTAAMVLDQLFSTPQLPMTLRVLGACAPTRL
jgi:glucokinase-like ROK family protein